MLVICRHIDRDDVSERIHRVFTVILYMTEGAHSTAFPKFRQADFVLPDFVSQESTECAMQEKCSARLSAAYWSRRASSAGRCNLEIWLSSRRQQWLVCPRCAVQTPSGIGCTTARMTHGAGSCSLVLVWVPALWHQERECAGSARPLQRLHSLPRATPR